MTLAVTTPRFV